MSDIFAELPAVPRQSTRFYILGASASAGFGLSGAESIAASNSAHWEATATFLIANNEEAHMAWQAFLARMQGAIGSTLVPAASRWQPRDSKGRKIAGAPATLSGSDDGLAGDVFWDHGVLDTPETVHVRLNAAASLRDGIITVNYPDAIGLRPGQFFSLGGNLHQVRYSHEVSAGVDEVYIRPLLRQDWAAGDPIEIARPVCRMRLADDMQGVLDLNFERLQKIEVKFVEVTGGAA